MYKYSINKWVFSYWTSYMSKVSHNGPRKVVLARGNAEYVYRILCQVSALLLSLYCNH